eukprot:COSAG01_NODE_7427_length_3213_cov_10.489724_3_plen_288_part_00
MAALSYQPEATERSLRATGRVGVRRDATGSDGGAFGVHRSSSQRLPVHNARELGTTLDECALAVHTVVLMAFACCCCCAFIPALTGTCIDREGVELCGHAWQHIDYYDEQRVLREYYPECCELVRRATGASAAIAFDHNIRCRGKSAAGVRLNGGNLVQTPASGVHADYTVTSAPQRLRQLSRPLGVNDTLRALHGEGPVLSAEEVERRLRGRYAFINVWRSIAEEPVHQTPLGVIDSRSVPLEDIITFEGTRHRLACLPACLPACERQPPGGGATGSGGEYGCGWR